MASFHLPNDVEARVAVLTALELDPLVINEDGTRVNAFAELAAEVFKKPRGLISFEERNEAMRAFQNKQAIDQMQNMQQASGYNFNNWGSSSFTDRQNERAADFIKRKYGL